MEYLSCPTCGYFIGQKSIKYDKEKEKICESNDLSEEEKSLKIKKLLNSLGLRRYCCKMRLMTCKDQSKEILPIQ